jgi:serine/threonine-protein phosphatase Stp1
MTNIGKKRQVNEDALLDEPERAVWAVADGMGGHESGDVASRMAVAALLSCADMDDVDAAIDAFSGALERTNVELLQIAAGGDRPRTIGTTVVALTIRQARFGCVWAGDSRCYLIRERQIEQLTQDHSLVQDLVRSGMLAPDEAESHPDANVITQAVGASRDLRLDRVSGEARAGDHFVLVSDGVTRKLSDDELCVLVASRNPHQAAQEIERIVLERGAPDNLTAVIVRVM